jgi:UPF0489 domain
MRVLDIDLDFFLDYVAWSRGEVERLEDHEYTPWSDQEVILFIEDQCGLSRSRLVPGRIVVNHDEAFLYWRELVQSKRLTTPFEVVHVDAHSDLGLGDAGYRHLMSEVLSWDLSERQFPNFDIMKGCGMGNYVAFAIACRWLSRLVFVTHPDWRHDLLQYHFKNYDTASEFIQLKVLNEKQLGDLPIAWVSGRVHEIVPIRLEPEIPFRLVPSSEFEDTDGFDFVVLSQSPGFTPPSADRLIPLIAQYILAE